MVKTAKHILIVSDNLGLLKRFHSLVEHEQYSDYSFAYRISPFSDRTAFQTQLNFPIDTIDMRDSDTIETLAESYSFIFSLHCKQLFPKKLIDRVKCINVHPGYNPVNRGWYPQVFALIHDLPIGATIHEIDEQLDHGRIIDRQLVEKDPDATSLTLYNKVVEAEIHLLEKNLLRILQGDYVSYEDHENEHLFLKEDFNQLKKLDLEDVDTLGNHLNKLRALTHGDFKNAFFIDRKTGEKIYVRIQLERENSGSN